MAKLKDLAYVIRSKNAGPFEVTLDILFENETIYRRVRDTGAIDAGLFARLYGIPESQCNFIAFDKGWSAMLLLVSITRTLAKARSSSVMFSTREIAAKPARSPPTEKLSTSKPETNCPLESRMLV